MNLILWRRSAVFAGVAAAVVSMVVGGPAASAAPDTAPAAFAAGVSAAQDLGVIAQNPHILYNGAFVSGRDNGQSTGYQGHSVWIFNDTALTDNSLLTNSGAMTDDTDASDGLTLTSASPFTSSDSGVPGSLIPMTLNEFAFQADHNGSCTIATDPYCGSVFAYWPGAIVADPQRHRLLTFYGKLCRGQSDEGAPCYNGFAGQEQGDGIAALDMDSHTVTRLDAVNMPAPVHSVDGDDLTLMWGPGQAYGNNSAFVSGDMLYGYGHCVNFRCRLGRVPLASVQDRAQWRFYAGDSGGQPVWSADESAAVSVLDSGAAGGTVQWVPGLNAWLDTYMAPLSDTAYYETAPNPWGPWSAAQRMFDGQAPASGVDYASYAHPELAQNNGLTQYISYFLPGTGYQRLERVDFTP
ncbi:DUF4185 domain-containing protein [Streptomyces sp. NPDC020917]|uniref:DUF4185 domain-containing protein n=1 Tax=Streptomyces sp. NPDC020917 TaxID=3365102 RepID=UPI0037AE9ABE